MFIIKFANKNIKNKNIIKFNQTIITNKDKRIIVIN